jgi:preprotein translocase subunit SecA
MKERFGFEPEIDEKKALEREELVESLWGQVEKIIEAREAEFTLPALQYFCRYFYLEEIDARWIEHLKGMEALREGIGLRGYGQKDPKQEYKKEGFVIFGEMMQIIGRNVCEKLFHMQIQREEAASTSAPASVGAGGAGSSGAPQIPAMAPKRAPRKIVESGGGIAPEVKAGNGDPAAPGAKPMRRAEPKVGRNDPCPCGSGKKYKKCHGAQATV